MVTAYIHGPSLQDAVTDRGPLSLDQVCTLGAELAEGLAAIHDCGLVHRDLKPGNVILAEDGPRIIDFGIARATEASPITTAGFVVGTCSYMSPEQVPCSTNRHGRCPAVTAWPRIRPWSLSAPAGS